MTLRIFFCIASLAILVLCFANYWVELTPTWKGYQREYYALLAEKIEDPQKEAQIRGMPLQFEQIYNQELNVADRCVICHLGMENSLMEDAPNPHKTHPGNLLASHPYQQIGCTICHHGQGLATTLDDAHGHVAHWNQPLLSGDFVQATCTKCHDEDEVPNAPVLTRGKRLLRDLGCVGCHQTGEPAAEENVGPRLAAIGSKVSRKWLNKWLVNPKGYLPDGKMPHFRLRQPAANALAAYLMTFTDKAIDALSDEEGDYDAGAAVYRNLQCIVCHRTREDSEGNLVGGDIGPSLLKIGSKVNKRWLVAFLQDPHDFYPNTKMPRFHFSGPEVRDLAQFAMEEWIDWDLPEPQQQEPDSPPDSPELIEQGQRLYAELGCAGCHDLTDQPPEIETVPPGPELTFIGSKPVHDLDFGAAKVPHTLPDFLYTKLKSPQALNSDFRLPPGKDPAAALWKNLQPTALFSGSMPLPEGTAEERLAWILARVQEQMGELPDPEQTTPDQEEQEFEEEEPAEAHPEIPKPALLDPDLTLPEGSTQEQATWLAQTFNDAGLLNPLKMPDFLLGDADAEALTIALMSLSAERIASKRFEVPRTRKVFFNPKDEFGRLERRYRCLSCHSIRGSGDPLASDLTFEGSRANRQWLYEFLKKPYSMRRTITIAMPIFNFPDEEARFMAEYMSRVFVDIRIGEGWRQGRDRADVDRGKALFDAKGCIACHQVNDKGGDIGPNLTIQADIPHGTWVGDKLRGEWIYQWLKDPHSLVPGTLEPKGALSDQQALDLTAYLLSLKNPEFPAENGPPDL